MKLHYSRFQCQQSYVTMGASKYKTEIWWVPRILGGLLGNREYIWSWVNGLTKLAACCPFFLTRINYTKHLTEKSHNKNPPWKLRAKRENFRGFLLNNPWYVWFIAGNALLQFGAYRSSLRALPCNAATRLLKVFFLNTFKFVFQNFDWEWSWEKRHICTFFSQKSATKPDHSVTFIDRNAFWGLGSYRRFSWEL